MRGKKIHKKYGSRQVWVKTLHGSYPIRIQRYALEDGRIVDNFPQIGYLPKTHYSPGLQTYVLGWLPVLSYPKVKKLLKEHTEVDLSVAGLQEWSIQQATQISQGWASQGLASTALLLEPIQDLYAPSSKEIVVFIDDVGVKAQKPHHRIARQDTDAKRIDTTVILLQTPEASFETLTQGIEAEQSTENLGKRLKQRLQKHYPQGSLPVVAITDGGRSLRLFLHTHLGEGVCIILDWWHLQKKICDLLSMISANKPQKEQDIGELRALLWQGKVAAAQQYLQAMSKVKNTTKHAELLTYLDKHRLEIIDYQKRQQAGKPIGSGRGEKANDMVVARRQKNQGMSWSLKGSRALAILSTQQRNQNMVA